MGKLHCLQIPTSTLPGSHRMVVEGLAATVYGDPVFRNETELQFETKYISVFIQTDRYVYFPTNSGELNQNIGRV